MVVITVVLPDGDVGMATRYGCYGLHGYAEVNAWKIAETLFTTWVL